MKRANMPVLVYTRICQSCEFDEKISCFYHMIMTPNGKNMVSTTKNNSIARAAYLKLVKTLNKR